MILLPLSIIMGCVGYIFKCHPPTERNGWYGYRTKKSMANDAIGLKHKTIWHLFSKILMGFITVWNYRTRN